MRTYADPTSCPSCGTHASAAERCDRCAVLLRGEAAQRVLRLLTDADGVLLQMRLEAAEWRRRATRPAPVPAPALAGAAPAPAPAPPRPPAQGWGPPPPPLPPIPPQEPRRGGWSVGNLLLALGALCLVVAAVVFISISWDRMGLGGRTAVLAGVTVLTAGVAGLVTARRLRGSAEALWAVTVALVTLDYWAARAFGLAGLDRLGDAAAVLGFGAVLAVVGAAIATTARRRLPVLLVDELTLVAASIALVGGTAGVDDGSPASWTAAVVVGGLLTVALVVGRLRVAAVGAATVTALAYVVLSLAHLDGLVDWVLDGPRGTDPAPLWTVPVVVLAFLPTLVARLAVPAQQRLRTVLLAAGTWVGVGHLVLVPLVLAAAAPRVDDHVLAVSVVLAVAAPVVAALAQPDLGAATTGLRAAAATLVLGVAGLLLGWVVVAVAATFVTTTDPWTGDLASRMATTDDLGAWWGEPVLAAAAAAVLLLASTWAPATLLGDRVRRVLRRAAAVVLPVGVVLPTLLTPLPVLVPAGVVLVVATGLVAAGAHRRADALLIAGTVALAPAVVVALVAQSTSVVVWLLAALVCAGATVAARGAVALALPAAVGTVLGLAAVPAATSLLDAPVRGTQLASALAVVLVGLLAQAAVALVPQATRPARRLPIEVVTAVAGLVVLGVSLGEGATWAALVFTVVGAGAVLVGLVAPDRRAVALVGSVLLGVAYVLRLVASDVTVVEAYTLPLAALLLGAGVVALGRRPGLRTWAALGPGLLLALGPSLPQALEDPTTLRGLLLTAGALAVVGLGAAARWQAPVVTGSVVAVVMVLRHLGPVADAVPRWALLAAAGVVLLAVGITWEQRVRQARSAVVALAGLR